MNRKFYAILLILVVLLAGCGNGNSNEENSELSAQADELTSNEEEVLPESLQYTIYSSSGNKRQEVIARVIADGYDNAEIFPVEETKIDEDYLRELASKIFDDGDYTVEKPYIICTRDELMEKQEDIMSRISMDDYSLAPEAIYEIEAILDNYDESHVMDWTDDQVIVSIKEPELTFANMSFYTGAQECEYVLDTALIEGRIDGQIYQLFYGTYENGTTLTLRSREAVTKPDTVASLYTDIFSDYPDISGYDIDSARDIARTTIDKMGFYDFEEQSAGKRLCMNAMEEPFLDGYNIYYTRTINLFANTLCDNTEIMTTDEENTCSFTPYGQEYVCVRVDHSGITSLSIYHPYTVWGTRPSDVELLAFSTVDEIAHNTIGSILDMSEVNPTALHPTFNQILMQNETINKVVFSYIVVNRDGVLQYEPTWLYLSQSDDEYKKQFYRNPFAVLGVNAIDGSVTYFAYNNPLSFAVYGYPL